MFKKIKSAFYALKVYGLKKCVFNALSMWVSDVCVVSFQKSGQTWTRVMFRKVLSLKYGIKKLSLETHMLTLFKPAPNVWFTHAGCTINQRQRQKSLAINDKALDFIKMLKRKKIILLVRDPRDEIVSLFHDHTKRNFCYEKGDTSKFLRDPDWGLRRPIDFMNLWAEEMDKRKEDFLLVRYEDLKNDAHKELKRILDFVKIKVDNYIINEAVKYGSFENMRKMEMARKYKDHRMLPKNINDPNSYRTRKGKVGSHKEELNEKDIEYMNKEIKEKLNPIFGYSAR